MRSKVIKGQEGHLKISFFLRYNFCLMPNRFQTFQECQYHEDTNFS